MRKFLNLRIVLSIIIMIICLNTGFSQTLSLNQDWICAPKNKEVRIFPFDNDVYEAGTLNFASFRIITEPEKGELSWNASNYTLTLVPNVFYTGDDFFIYEICTFDGECDQARVNLGLTDPIMIPVFDSYISYNGPVSGNVITNDILDHNLLSGYSILLEQDVSNGILDFQSDGSFTYTADDGFIGKDYFSYKLCIKGNCDPTLVSINVVDLPNNESYYVVANDIALSINANTSLYNFDLHKTNLSQIDPASVVTYTIINGFQNGVGNITNDGKFSYIPYYNVTGMDELVYEVCVDGECQESIILIDIMEEQFNCSRHFPQALNDNLVTCSGQEVGVNVAQNDYFFDANLDSRVELVRDVEHGDLIIEQDGTLRYTPDFGFVGIDYLEYKICKYDFASLSYPSKFIDNSSNIIIDGSISEIEDGLIINPQGALSNINVELDIEHEHLSNLEITLLSPSGRSIVLLNNLCDSDTPLKLIISDLATQDVDCSISSIQYVRPYESFGPLEKQEIKGDWMLKIRNLQEDSSIGKITKWGVKGDVTPFKEKFCRIARVEIPVLSKGATVALNLLGFSVTKANGNTAEISWISEESGEAENYELQRSQVNSEFKTIHTAIASNRLDASYNYLDKVSNGGQTYYRLKKNEYDGSHYFSDVKTIRFDNPNNIRVRSTTVNDKLEVLNTEDVHGQLEILDLSGRTVEVSNIVGTPETSINVANLSAGIYILNIRLENEHIALRWIKS